ncbi:hypothetical protein FRB96_006317 [Tulasnella sp. 330]|nr:hypothetical protein FRB96_006317 [Tulasnella sp. 330]
MLTPEQRTAIEGVLETILELKANSRGRTVAEPFLDLPDREAWKEYYLVIPHPRCLHGIKEGIGKGSYTTAQSVYDDLTLLFANALHFNEDGSGIAKDARTLKVRDIFTTAALPTAITDPFYLQTLFETTWAADPILQKLPPIFRDATPPPKPQPMEDIDSSPANTAAGGVGGAGGDTNWENMKPRDKQGDDIVRKVESQLPKWKGPSGEEGWITLEAKETNDPYTHYGEVLSKLKALKNSDGEGLPSEALTRIDENAVLPECSFTTPMSLALVENRVLLRGYPSPKDFDMDMMRLLEKGRRWFEPGSKDYGRILVLQRFYQGLTSSATARNLLSTTASAHYSSVPAGPGYAKPLHHAQDSGAGVTTYRIQNKDRTFIRNVWFKGVEYRMGDYVHLIHPDDPERPIIGQIFKCYVPDSGPVSHYVTVCWYFRPEQTFHSPQRAFWDQEVFKTGHFADHAVEDLIEKVACQFMTRHIRGRPKPPNWYINWPLYVCDSRYNDRDRVFVRIKNWASCIPDELRKGSGEGFYPIVMFEKTVMPRRVESPFIALSGGAKAVPTGPGGLVDEDEGRRKSKRTAATKVSSNGGAGETGTPAPSEAMVDIFAAVAGPSNAAASIAAIKGSGAAKALVDRSLTVAAGGRSMLGAEPMIEMLPEETARRFDRDPRTNEILWFTGPPIERVNPEAFNPRYSMAYLAFLAKKKAAVAVAAEDDEDMDEEEDDDEQERRDRANRRKRMRMLVEGEEVEKKWVAPPTLLDTLFTRGSASS